MGKSKQQNKRQIDYILINQRFRNNVKSAQTVEGRQANMQQDKQHKTVRMQICLKLAKKITEKHQNPKQEQNNIQYK